MTAALLALLLLAAPAEPEAPPADLPLLDPDAPADLSLGGGAHGFHGLSVGVLAARASLSLPARAGLNLGPFEPQIALQVSYGRTPAADGLGRFLGGITWVAQHGPLHAGLGVDVGATWVDGPGHLAPGLLLLLGGTAGLDLARVHGVRIGLDLRAGVDPWSAGTPELLAFLTVRP
jgi:hypothetical protein